MLLCNETTRYMCLKVIFKGFQVPVPVVWWLFTKNPRTKHRWLWISRVSPEDLGIPPQILVCVDSSYAFPTGWGFLPRHICHILPHSEIDLGLCLADFTDFEGKHLFHWIGWKGRIWQLCKTNASIIGARQTTCVAQLSHKHILPYLILSYPILYHVIYHIALPCLILHYIILSHR